MFPWLLLLFTVLPAVELYLLIRLGQVLGPGETVLLVVLTGLVGAALARREGVTVLLRLQGEAARGFPTGDRMLEAALVFAGGVLLITPGVITDATGILLLVPPVRRLLVPPLKRLILRRITVVGPDGTVRGPEAPAASHPPGADRHFDHPVA